MKCDPREHPDEGEPEEIDTEWSDILRNVERQLADLDNTSTSSCNLDELLSNAAYWEQREQQIVETPQRRQGDDSIEKAELKRDFTEETSRLDEEPHGQSICSQISASEEVVVDVTNIPDDQQSNVSITTISTSTTTIPRLITCEPTHPIHQEEILSGDPIELIRYSCPVETSSEPTKQGVQGELQTHAQAFDALMTAHLDAARQGASSSNVQLEKAESAIIAFVKDFPLVLQVQYHFSQLEASCWPLHYFSAMSCLEACKLAHSYFAEAIGLADSGGDLPLHYACYMQASLDVVQLLLSRYPAACKHTNDLLQIPLHSVVLVNSPPITLLEVLLNTYPAGASLADADGQTPLHLLLSHQPHLELVQLLVATAPHTLQLGNLNEDSPLHVACRHGASLPVVAWLLQHEPQAAIRQNQQGFAPLHLAVAHRHWHLVEALASDACTRIVTNNGQLPMDVARAKSCPAEILDFLLPSE